MSQRSRPISTAQLEDGRAARGHSKGARHGCERAHRRTFAAPRDATAAIRVIAVLEELRPLIPPRPARSESALPLQIKLRHAVLAQRDERDAAEVGQ